MGGVTWIEASAERIEVVGDVVVPFEPRRDAERSLRRDLRDALPGLDVQRSELLLATFGGLPPRGADVENLLLYNIDAGGGLFSRGCGVQVEQSHPAGDAPFAYRYVGGRVDGPVGLRLAVGVPEHGVVAPAALVKGLIDGAVSALTRAAAPPADAAARSTSSSGSRRATR